MRPGITGFREPGFRFAGQVDSSGGGGSSAAADITIVDAGGFYASTNVEGALQEAYTAINLRAKLADLAATTLGKGASLIGTHDGSLLIGGLHPTVEDSLVSIASDTDAAQTDATTALANAATANAGVAINTAAIALRPLITDLASNAAGKGASTIGLQDAGGFYATKNVEFALQQLGPLGTGAFTVALSSTLTDAGTNTAPDLFTIAHLSSGTPATNFGITVGRELHSSTNVRRRALAEVTKWTTATNAAETASHTLQLRTGGALTDTLTLGATSNFPTSGSAAAPSLTVGTVGDLLGLYRSSSGELGFGASGARLGRWSSSGLLADTIYVGPLGSAPSPTFTVNGTTGGTGLYGLASGFAMSILNSDTFVATKGGAAFKFTGLPPGSLNTASTEFVGFDVAMGRTSTWSTGALTTQREVLVRKPTYAFGSASTITNGATFAIEGAPVLGSNATAVSYVAGSVGVASTFINTYSLWSQAGNVRFDAADAATNTNTELVSYRHTTSGTAAAGFGLTATYDLQNGAGFVRRAVQETTGWQVATDGSEEGSRSLYLMQGGTLRQAFTFGYALGANIPTLSFAATGQGFIYNSGTLATWMASTQQMQWTTTTIASNVLHNFTDRAAFAPIATGSGVLTKLALTPGADTGTTASTEAFDVSFDLSRTRTWATGALATQRAVRIKGPTYAFVGASVVTSAATLAIESAPAAGANATLTNSYAFWVQAGGVRFDGNFGFQKAPVAQQNTTGTATGFTAGGGTAVTDSSTFTGGTGATAYRISDIVLAMKNYGLLAA